MDVAVLLGCPAWPGTLPPAALRRVARAASLYASTGGCLLVASGGRSWDDGISTEADCFAQALLVRGVAPEHILRERCSMNTRDNALYSVTLLRRRGLSPRWVVTCDTHAARAQACFRAAGVDVELVPAPSPRGPRKRITRSIEWLRARAWPPRGMVLS